MHPRILVRLGGGLLVLAGLLLTVQAVAQRQPSPGRAPAPQAERSPAPTVRFRGHVRNELLQSRIERISQALAGQSPLPGASPARAVQSAGAGGLELLPERSNIAIVRPTEEGSFEVICEESPERARAILTGSSQRRQ